MDDTTEHLIRSLTATPAGRDIRAEKIVRGQLKASEARDALLKEQIAHLRDQLERITNPVRDLPRWVRALIHEDAAELRAEQDRPYKWLLDVELFGTLCYRYLSGTKDKKRLTLKQVCKVFVNRNDEPMNDVSIRNMKSQGKLPESLPDGIAAALEHAGYEFAPFPARWGPPIRRRVNPR